MITATDTRKMARESLSGRWGKGALIAFCYTLIDFALSILLRNILHLESTIYSILTTLISLPLSFGLIVSFIKLKRGEEVNPFDFLTIGFSSFSRVWKVCLSRVAKLIFPIILLVVSFFVMIFGISSIAVSSSIFAGSSADPTFGIMLTMLGLVLTFVSLIVLFIKSLHYVLSFYIAYDNPDMPSKDVVLASKSLMTNNRGNYFVLILSFIGWAILACFTLGIGVLWLIPYVQVTLVCFYETLANTSNYNNETEQVNQNEEMSL